MVIMFQFCLTQATRTKFCEGLYQICCIKRQTITQLCEIAGTTGHVSTVQGVVSVGSAQSHQIAMSYVTLSVMCWHPLN